MAVGRSDSVKAKSYKLDYVFGPSASQGDVFDTSGAKTLIDEAVAGFACTLFAFGQTGSGKTHTITGPDAKMDGILPRAIHYLFDRIAQETSEYVRFAIQASYIEIYNENVRDLLNVSSGVLPVRWREDRGFYVENLYVVLTESVDDMIAVAVEGMTNRAQRAHDINEHSSRSHSIVTMYVTSETYDPATGSTSLRHGKLSFVDLAGSERVKDSRATGEGLTEARNINRSLLALGKCIAALSDAEARGVSVSSSSSHIPFRDSKLTKLLKDSLGGNGITLMIACLSPHDHDESIKTLRYAARTKHIRNKPIIMLDPRDKLVADLRREIDMLRKENAYLREEQAAAPASARSPAVELPSLASARSSRPPPRARPPSANLEPREAVSRLAEAESVIAEYMKENDAIKLENHRLSEWQQQMSRDHANAIRSVDMQL